jgi:hypothetical protein
VWSRSDFLECVASIRRFGDAVTCVLKGETQNAAQAVFIFNEEDVRHFVGQ